MEKCTPIAECSHPHFENEFHDNAHSHRQARHAVNHPSRCPLCSEYRSEELRCGIGDPCVLTELGSGDKGNREADHAHHSIERAQMRARRREGVQGSEISRTSSVFRAQIASNTSYKLRRTAL